MRYLAVYFDNNDEYCSKSFNSLNASKKFLEVEFKLNKELHEGCICSIEGDKVKFLTKFLGGRKWSK